ncbi:TatD family hydrolase [bacterium]|nr:TatD family hydrolase [bacterium]
MEKNYIIDTHCHIDMIEDISVKEILENAENNSVKKIIIPSADRSSFDKIIELAISYEQIYCMLGVFPEEAKTWNDNILDEIKNLAAKNKKIVGIGEIGLDYYWDKTFIDLQKEIFIKQIQLANELNLPINVHDREAHKDTFDIIKENNKTSKVVLHCFSGSIEFAKECIKEGWYISLGGVVTFKNAKKMKEVAENIDENYLLLETDSPYLTPVPYRGKPNQPAYTKFTAQEIANLRQTTLEHIMEVTTQNAYKVFKFEERTT